MKKIQWNRGSWTDKGVHASKNVIKANLMLSTEYLKDTEVDMEKVDKRFFKNNVDFGKIV